jgi:hypothetical protein
MNRLLTLLLLLPALTLAQGVTPPAGFANQEVGFTNPLKAVYGGAPVAASFGQPSCIPTGGNAGKAAPLTVTRAGATTVAEPNTNQQTPGLISEDAGTVSHVVFNGGNQILNSNNFAGASWVKRGASVATTDGTLCPDGTTANKITVGAMGVDDIYTFGTGTLLPGPVGASYLIKRSSASGSLRIRNTQGVAYGFDDVDLAALGANWVSVAGTTTGVNRSNQWVSQFLGAGYLVSANAGTLSAYLCDMQQVSGPIMPYAATGGVVMEGLINTRGNSWTQNGMVPQNPSTWNAPPSAGAFSDANYYTAPYGTLPASGDFTVCAVLTSNTLAGNTVPFSAGGNGINGWYINASASAYSLYTDNAAVAGSGTPVLGKPQVLCVGRAGALAYAKMDGLTTGSVATTTTPHSRVGTIGRYTNAGFPFLGTVHEVYATTTPWNEAAVSALQASVMAKINQPVLATCPANTLAVGPSGAEVYAAATNAALQSSTSCVANTVQTPWALTGTPTCVSDAAVAPDGTTSMDEWTNSASGHGPTQILATASSTTATGSVWLSKPTGTGSGGVALAAAGATLCACGTSDGSACSAAIFSVNYCKATATALTTTPIRLWLTRTTAVAQTDATMTLSPGEWAVSAGTTRFWGVQVEVGSYPTPYIPTTTTAVTRSATVASVPLPDFSATGTACFGVTYTPGQDWNITMGASTVVLSNYTGVLANALQLAKGTGNLSWTVYDNAGAAKSWTWTHGLGAVRTPKRIVACMAAGTLSMYADGVAVGSGAGVGTALQSATLTPLYLGQNSGGQQVDGSISNVRVYPNQTYRAGM